MTTATSLYCSCHNTEMMGKIYPGEKLEVKDGRHGIRHTLEMSPAELLRSISGTVDGSAIIQFVRSVVSTA